MYVCVKGAILGLSHANQVPVKSVPDGPKATPALKVIVYKLHAQVEFFMEQNLRFWMVLGRLFC